MKDPRLSAMAARVSGGTVRTAGRIEFVRDQGPLRRDIRVQGFVWNPEVHRNLAKTLWAVQRAHSYGMAALRLFSKMNSSEFSPDGLLGGRGYIQKVKELRSGLSQSVEVLSTFVDTMHDEVNSDHWAAAMEKDPSTEAIVTEAEQANPGEYVEQQFKEEVPSAEEGLESYSNPEPDDFNPFVEGEEEKDEDEGTLWDWGGGDGEGAAQASGGFVVKDSRASRGTLLEDWVNGETAVQDYGPSRLLTEDEAREAGRRARRSSAMGGEEVPLPGPKSGVPTDAGVQGEGLSDAEMVMNTTGEADVGKYAAAIRRMVVKTASFRRSGEPVRVADSSVDPVSLPGGPRIQHVGPGESPEELGGYTDDDFMTVDAPGWDGFQGTDPVYEGKDANMDGVSGYSDPTDGDVTTFAAMAARVASGYSWLPGSRNEKLMPYYDPRATPEDVAWMMANDAPDPPESMRPKVVKPPRDPLWDAVLSDGERTPD